MNFMEYEILLLPSYEQHEHDENNQQDKSYVGSLQERICGVCGDEETRYRWSGRAFCNLHFDTM